MNKVFLRNLVTCKLCLKIILILLITFSQAKAQDITSELANLLSKTVVQIIPWDKEAQAQVPWLGSGTIISPRGHVLTNHHVVSDLESQQNFEWHIISVTQPNAIHQPPQPTYWARYIVGDSANDLAILKIELLYIELFTPEDITSPIPDDMTFPVLPIGNSDKLSLGNSINVIGYPFISGSTITFTRGTMSGWAGEDFKSGGQQWIKT